jgi:type I restriction enzyme M protein
MYNLGHFRCGQLLGDCHKHDFNKYFYRHKPLRGLDLVTADILALEQQADGLISEILGVPVAALSEVK